MKRVILALSVLAAPRAYASSCGGGGGSSSSGGGGGGGGGSSSSDSGSTTATGCLESTDVEGYRECHTFGEWAQSMVLPHMFVEMGMGMRRFATLARGDGTVTHGDETFAYRVAMPAGSEHSDTAIVWTGRFGLVTRRGLYAGIEGEIGALSPAASTPQMEDSGAFGSPTLAQRGGLMIGAYGIAGMRVPLSHGAVAVEAAGGVRDVQYAWHSTYHDCEQTTTVGAASGVLEARVRGELWINPWFTAGVSAGASVLERGDYTAGLYLGMHTRSFR